MRKMPKTRMIEPNGLINWWKDPEPELIEWWEEYRQECDKCAAIEAAKTGKRHWGRWYLTKGKVPCLVTTIIHPNTGEDGYKEYSIYEIGLYRCETEAEREQWKRHMGFKDWVGEQGVSDLNVAFQQLIEEGMIRPSLDTAEVN